MCIFRFLRTGEVVAPPGASFDPSIRLSVGNVSVNSRSAPTYVAVNIKASKMDLFRQGVTIYLGRTHNQICPLAATLNYLVARGTLKGPRFIFEHERHLTRDHFVAAVHEALSTTGVDISKYVGHSFWIGAATTAAKPGIQDSLIRTMGRWESFAYLLYIRTPRERICSMAKTLLGDMQSANSKQNS